MSERRNDMEGRFGAYGLGGAIIGNAIFPVVGGYIGAVAGSALAVWHQKKKNEREDAKEREEKEGGSNR